MRPSNYTQSVPVYLDDIEVMIDCEYDFTPGVPAQGPSYASGGQPAEGPEIEITGMSVKGVEVPGWFYDAVMDGERVEEWIAEHHDSGDDEPPERERWVD